MTSVPVMSLGIRSGVNWMRLKASLSVCASVEMSSVFARPGTPTSSACAAREDRDQQFVDHLVLADDHLGELVPDRRVRLLEILDRLDVAFLHSACRDCYSFGICRCGRRRHRGPWRACRKRRWAELYSWWRRGAEGSKRET